MADGDIEGAIMDALKTIFTNELITAYALTDRYRLHTLTEFPLQDDPTQVAPYVAYAVAYEIGRMPANISGAMEIGAGPLWRTYFKAVCGTPYASTKIQAYKDINELSRRIERSVMKHFDLSNVSSPTSGLLFSGDGSEYVDAMNPLTMWVRTLRRAYGGDGTFYGEALMFWSYNFRRPRDWV